MSSVRNLAAMFEANKGENTSPDRGRSQNVVGSEGRPLSKVRTNFVAVEKNGRIGLRRDPSGESSASRRLSNETDAESTTVTLVNDKAAMSQEDAETGLSLAATQAAAPGSPSNDAKGTAASSPAEVIPEEPSAVSLQLVTEKLAETHADQYKMSDDESKTDQDMVSTGGSSPKHPDKEKEIATLGIVSANQTDRQNGTSKGKAASARDVKPATSKVLRKPATITRSNSKSAASAPGKGTAANSPGRGRPSTTMAAKKQISKPSSAASSRPSSRMMARKDEKPAAGRSIQAPKAAKAQASPSIGVSGTKPKPKSPIRNGPLSAVPAASAAASSVSRARSQPRPSTAHVAGSLQAPQTHPRPHSPVSPSVAPSAAMATRLPRHQGSSVGRTKPAIGPPPKKTGQDHSATKRERELDDSFLARMTRPTQSSSSKAMEKIPVTPPPKPQVRKTASGGTSGGDGRRISAKSSGRLSTKSTSPKSSAGALSSTDTANIETATATMKLAEQIQLAPPKTPEPAHAIENKMLAAPETAATAPTSEDTVTPDVADVPTVISEGKNQALDGDGTEEVQIPDSKFEIDGSGPVDETSA